MAVRDIVIISDNPGPDEAEGIHFTVAAASLPRLPVVGDGILTSERVGASRLYTVTEVRFAMKPGKIGERSGELVDLHVRVDLVSSIDEGYDDGGGEGGGTRGDGNVGREQGHLV